MRGRIQTIYEMRQNENIHKLRGMGLKYKKKIKILIARKYQAEMEKHYVFGRGISLTS